MKAVESEVCLPVCQCVSCVSAWVHVQGRWIVSHQLWLIKRRQSKWLILTHCLMVKTRRWTHTPGCAHTCPISQSLDFFLNCLFCAFPPRLSTPFCSFMDKCAFSEERKKSTHVHTHTHTQWTSSVLTPPYVGLGVVADAKTRGTSRYQQSTACLLPLTHHHQQP